VNPSEVHINLVVYDAEAAASGLRVAALKLLGAAERSADPDAVEYFYRAYYCVLALAALYERFQAFPLNSEAAAAHALPALCGNWRYLMGDLDQPQFPTLTMLGAADMAGGLVQESVEQRAAHGERQLQLRVERDENGEWAAAVDARLEPSVAEDAFASIGRHVARFIEWVKHRSARAGVSGGAGDPALPAPTA
jgi:hypothetical protein